MLKFLVLKMQKNILVLKNRVKNITVKKFEKNRVKVQKSVL